MVAAAATPGTIVIAGEIVTAAELAEFPIHEVIAARLTSYGMILITLPSHQ
jgi:hypothetical protein